jgi:outer membrane lipoprotein-sorting protein
MTMFASIVLLALVLDSTEGILERMRSAQQDLETLEARLEQVKSYPQLGIEDPVERGFLYFQPGKLRLEIREPEARILVVKDGRYLLYQPRIRQAISGKLESGTTKGLFPGLLTGSAESFRELEISYSSSDRGEENLGDRRVHHLSFRARADAAVVCQEIDLFVDTALLLPVAQKCREASGNEITLTLFDIERNVPLEKDLFEMEIPEGVEIIERGGRR